MCSTILDHFDWCICLNSELLPCCRLSWAFSQGYGFAFKHGGRQTHFSLAIKWSFKAIEYKTSERISCYFFFMCTFVPPRFIWVNLLPHSCGDRITAAFHTIQNTESVNCAEQPVFWLFFNDFCPEILKFWVCLLHKRWYRNSSFNSFLLKFFVFNFLLIFPISPWQKQEGRIFCC